MEVLCKHCALVQLRLQQREAKTWVTIPVLTPTPHSPVTHVVQQPESQSWDISLLSTSFFFMLSKSFFFTVVVSMCKHNHTTSTSTSTWDLDLLRYGHLLILIGQMSPDSQNPLLHQIHTIYQEYCLLEPWQEVVCSVTFPSVSTHTRSTIVGGRLCDKTLHPQSRK